MMSPPALSPTAQPVQATSPETAASIAASEKWAAMDEHLTIIDAAPPPLSSELRELWSYRELLGFLIWRELKTRYMQTALGASWVILQPLAMMCIFTIFFGKLAGLPADNVPYPIFHYAGLLLWIFFSNTLTGTSNSLVGNTQLVTKVYFPRLALPLAAVGARVVDFVIALSVLAAMMIHYRTPFTWQLLLTPLIVGLTALLCFGLGLRLAAWNVKYRDVGHLLPLVLQILMFASPIIYSTKLVPEKWRALYTLNPLVGLVGNFRAALFGLPFDWLALGLAAIITCAIFFNSLFAFRRMQETFADVI
jgi:lipopolysaccharide transport system permease protein